MCPSRLLFLVTCCCHCYWLLLCVLTFWNVETHTINHVILKQLCFFLSNMSLFLYFFFLFAKLAGTFRNSEKRNPCLMSVCGKTSSLMPLRQWCYCKSFLFKRRNSPSSPSLQVSLMWGCWTFPQILFYCYDYISFTWASFNVIDDINWFSNFE